MKFLLLPVTLFLWLISTYLLLWVGLSASLIAVNFSWMALLFSSAILYSVGIVIAVIVPTSISMFIDHFYNHNRFTNILHAIFGLLGVLLFLNYLTADHVKSVIHQNWNNHKWKCIVLSVPILGLFIGMVYSSISMVLKKNEDNEIHLDDDNADDFLEVKTMANPSTPTEKEMKEFILKARAFRAAKNKIKIQRERTAYNKNNGMDSEKDN